MPVMPNSEIGNSVRSGPEILVRPTRSTVSPFSTELTSITRAMLDARGLPFADAIAP